jgi:competence protein ComEA
VGSAPDATDAPATSTVTVHVTGGVVAAGVVTLPGDARVGDAVTAVGGRTDDADLERINLARVLVDGEHIHVPRVGEEPIVAVPEASGGAGAVGTDGLLDLNRATAEELETLPGIGPTRAAAIVEHREEHGPFAVPGDLRAVSGIGEATFQTLAPLVVVR